MYLEDTHLKDELLSVDVCQSWAVVVGKRAADSTSSTYFKDGVLFCNINSSIVRNRLHFNLDGIRTEINRRVGANVVKKIVLK